MMEGMMETPAALGVLQTQPKLRVPAGQPTLAADGTAGQTVKA